MEPLIFLEDSTHFLPDLFLGQNFSLLAIILLIASGLFLFTFEATEFNAKGFVLVSLMHKICKYDKFITMLKYN